MESQPCLPLIEGAREKEIQRKQNSVIRCPARNRPLKAHVQGQPCLSLLKQDVTCVWEVLKTCWHRTETFSLEGWKGTQKGMILKGFYFKSCRVSILPKAAVTVSSICQLGRVTVFV